MNSSETVVVIESRTCDQKTGWRLRTGQLFSLPTTVISVLYAGEQPNVGARQQDLILRERDVVPDVLIQQIVADNTDRDLADAGGIVLQPRGPGELRLQKIVARGRRLAGDRDVVLRERVQQAHACEPFVAAEIDAAAEALRRYAGHVGSIGEGGADDVVLA